MPKIVLPVSRIEGHAQVVIEVHAGRVVSARFKATEYRGFEHFVKGVAPEQMVVIVPRICGVCSTAHHLASVKALEMAFGVIPPPLALSIRELLMLGQMIQNQATSLFLFTMPDRLGLSSILEAAGEAGSAEQLSSLAQRALQVRNAGTKLIDTAGGQFIHPVKAVIGGVIGGIEAKLAETMHGTLMKALPMACELFDYYIEKSVALKEQLGTWGDDTPTHYIAAVSEYRPDYTGDSIRIMGPDGRILATFPASGYLNHIQFEDSEYSYSGKSSYGGKVFRANSLARINFADYMGTPLADRYLEQFRESFERPAHAILLFDITRGIELVYALERAIEILRQPLDNDETMVGYRTRDSEGYGLVEAPRGPLIHHYRITNGIISEAKFILPTVHNMMAIEQALRNSVERYIDSDRIDMEIERAVGRVVRAFDPCIACATH